MRRIGNLWQQIVSWDNLLLAYYKARRGKRHLADVARFDCHREIELLNLQEQLCSETYRPGEYRQFLIYERKPRVISVAPFRDRVVHHALMNIIDPILDKRFIYDSYACRKGKGVHAAVNRYQHFAQRYRYVLKLDVRRYFPSIDHRILLDQLTHRIKDKKTLSILKCIIECSPKNEQDNVIYYPGDDFFTPLARPKGLPIGNLTSQFFANLYLDDFDHWLKENIRVPAYLRYVDDLYLLADNKAYLWSICNDIEHYLATLRLSLHPQKRQIYQTYSWVDVLGYQIKPNQRRLRNDNGFRFRRKLRRMAIAYAQGRLNWQDINPSVQGWIGHALHADTKALRKSIFNAVKFVRVQA